MADSNGTPDDVTKKTKPKKIEVEPQLTTLDKDDLQNYLQKVTIFAKGQSHLNIRPESIKIQFVSKCLNADGDELCILPYDGKLHQLKIKKTTVNESLKKSILQGTGEHIGKKKELALVCPTTDAVVAVRINVSSKSETVSSPPEIFTSLDGETHSGPIGRYPQRTMKISPDIIVIDSDDEKDSCPTRQIRKIKQEPDADMSAYTRNKHTKKTRGGEAR